MYPRFVEQREPRLRPAARSIDPVKAAAASIGPGTWAGTESAGHAPTDPSSVRQLQAQVAHRPWPAHGMPRSRVF